MDNFMYTSLVLSWRYCTATMALLSLVNWRCTDDDDDDDPNIEYVAAPLVRVSGRTASACY